MGGGTSPYYGKIRKNRFLSAEGVPLVPPTPFGYGPGRFLFSYTLMALSDARMLCVIASDYYKETHFLEDLSETYKLKDFVDVISIT